MRLFCLSLAALVFAAAPAPATAESEAEDGFVVETVYYEFEIEREERAASATALPRKLLSLTPRVGTVIEYEGWRFNFEIGPRRMVGVAGGLDVDAWGYQASGYAAYWLTPWLLAGLGGGYQLDQGSLSNEFVDLPARLDTGSLVPFVAGGFPIGRSLVEGVVRLNIERAVLKVEGAGADRFATHDAEAGVSVVHPLNLKVDAELGVVARYTFKEDVTLDSQARAEQSALLVGAIDYRLSDQLSLRVAGELRVFDDVVDQGIVTLGLRQTF